MRSLLICLKNVSPAIPYQTKVLIWSIIEKNYLNFYKPVDMYCIKVISEIFWLKLIYDIYQNWHILFKYLKKKTALMFSMPAFKLLKIQRLIIYNLKSLLQTHFWKCVEHLYFVSFHKYICLSIYEILHVVVLSAISFQSISNVFLNT